MNGIHKTKATMLVHKGEKASETLSQSMPLLGPTKVQRYSSQAGELESFHTILKHFGLVLIKKVHFEEFLNIKTCTQLSHL